MSLQFTNDDETPIAVEEPPLPPHQESCFKRWQKYVTYQMSQREEHATLLKTLTTLQPKEFVTVPASAAAMVPYVLGANKVLLICQNSKQVKIYNRLLGTTNEIDFSQKLIVTNQVLTVDDIRQLGCLPRTNTKDSDGLDFELGITFKVGVDAFLNGQSDFDLVMVMTEKNQLTIKSSIIL